MIERATRQVSPAPSGQASGREGASVFGASAGQEVQGATARETVTLITCGGRFDQATRQYGHRLIVQAEWLLEEPQAG